MLADLSSSQFVEWQRFYSLEPFGAQIDEFHLAALRAQISNYLRPQNHLGYKVDDFMLCALGEKTEQSTEDMYRMFTGA